MTEVPSSSAASAPFTATSTAALSSSAPYSPAPFTSEPSPLMATLPTRALTSREKAAQAFPGSALRDNMLSPPEVEYASREQLEDAVQTFARGQGYAVTIKRSTAGERVYLKCDRGAVNVPKLGKNATFTFEHVEKESHKEKIMRVKRSTMAL